MENIHQNLANGSWQKMTLNEQMGNIGSEVGRVLRARDEQSRNSAFYRALDLFDLTASDSRRNGQLKEILRARELFVAASLNQEEYGTSLTDLDNYFLHFAVAARAGL
jgi:hypothetical protein